jgi:hypothetical protein
MSLLKTALIILFGFDVLIGMYDCGKYAHGGRDVREGLRYALISLIASLIDVGLLYWVLIDMP